MTAEIKEIEFSIGEHRVLTLRDHAELSVIARHVASRCAAGTLSRHYIIEDLLEGPVRVQLNHGDPAADEGRLAAVAGDLLKPTDGYPWALEDDESLPAEGTR